MVVAVVRRCQGLGALVGAVGTTPAGRLCRSGRAAQSLTAEGITQDFVEARLAGAYLGEGRVPSGVPGIR